MSVHCWYITELCNNTHKPLIPISSMCFLHAFIRVHLIIHALYMYMYMAFLGRSKKYSSPHDSNVCNPTTESDCCMVFAGVTNEMNRAKTRASVKVGQSPVCTQLVIPRQHMHP